MSGKSGRLNNVVGDLVYSRSQGPSICVGPPPFLKRCAPVRIPADGHAAQQLGYCIRNYLDASVVSEMLRVSFGSILCIAFSLTRALRIIV